MSFTEKTRLLAATARIANVPSVVCNVGTGFFLGMINGPEHAMDSWQQAALRAAGSGICLYLAGTFLNDWTDRIWDAKHRPERALPRGVFTPGLYLAMAASSAVLGIGLAVNLGAMLAAAGILAMVLLYSAIHKHTAWSVIPMGLCRALLPLLGASAAYGDQFSTSPEIFWISALAGFPLLCHVAGLSLAARRESSEKPGRSWPAWGLFILAAGPGIYTLVMSLAVSGVSLPLHFGRILPIAIYGAWVGLSLTKFRQPVKRQVSALLAGIPWVDGMILLPIAAPLLASAASPFVWCFLLLPPLAFLSGLLLQKLAPAT